MGGFPLEKDTGVAVMERQAENSAGTGRGIPATSALVCLSTAAGPRGAPGLLQHSLIPGM